MHLLVKFVARPGLEAAVIATISRALEISNPGSIARWRTVLCQRSNDPAQVIYVDPMAPAESVQKLLDTVEPELAPLLAAPISPKWCRPVTSFRRWSVDASVIGCVVLRVPPERSIDVIDRIISRGESLRHDHPGLVAYQALVDEADPGFVVMLHEWRNGDDLDWYRSRAGGGLSEWVSGEVGGEYHRYEYHAPALLGLPQTQMR